MRNIADNVVIQIEVTNSCHLSCANCTRFVGHHRSPFFMALDQVRQAIRSLGGFPGRIGLMGGEPMLHPQILEIMAIYREMIPDRRKRELWTAGYRWDELKPAILETFDEDLIAFNDHTQATGRHQPLLVSAEELVPDPVLRRELIENCWVQAKWSAAITPKGAFFCEIAAARSHLLDGPRGYPIEPGWWKRTVPEFQDQVEQFCHGCSAPIPMETRPDGRGGRDGATIDQVSPKQLVALLKAGSPKARRGQVEILFRQPTREEIEAHRQKWRPSEFRPFVAHKPEDYVSAAAPTCPVAAE